MSGRMTSPGGIDVERSMSDMTRILEAIEGDGLSGWGEAQLTLWIDGISGLGVVSDAEDH